MLRPLYIFGLFALMATPALAGTKACNATLVAQGVCPSTAYQVLFYAVSTADPDGAGPRPTDVNLILDAFTATFGWTGTTVCTQQLVNQGVCIAGQLGTVVPITKAAFTDAFVRAHFVAVVRRYLESQAVAAAQAATAAEPDPVMGN